MERCLNKKAIILKDCFDSNKLINPIYSRILSLRDENNYLIYTIPEWLKVDWD